MTKIQTMDLLKGRSLNWLANSSGIALATLRRRLIDPSGITMKEVLRIADALGTDPIEVFGTFKELTK